MPRTDANKILDWAVGRWRAEVANRPLQNIHRRTLDDTWRQIIRHLGGDDAMLLGPRHDELLDLANNGGHPQPNWPRPRPTQTRA